MSVALVSFRTLIDWEMNSDRIETSKLFKEKTFPLLEIRGSPKSNFKIKSGNQLSNFVSTLSKFTQVLERLVYEQLYAFLDKHSILYKYQFGFKKDFWTGQATLEITDSFNMAIDNKQITCDWYPCNPVKLEFSKCSTKN